MVNIYDQLTTIRCFIPAKIYFASDTSLKSCGKKSTKISDIYILWKSNGHFKFMYYNTRTRLKNIRNFHKYVATCIVTQLKFDCNVLLSD